MWCATPPSIILTTRINLLIIGPCIACFFSYPYIASKFPLQEGEEEKEEGAHRFYIHEHVPVYTHQTKHENKDAYLNDHPSTPFLGNLFLVFFSVLFLCVGVLPVTWQVS